MIRYEETLFEASKSDLHVNNLEGSELRLRANILTNFSALIKNV